MDPSSSDMVMELTCKKVEWMIFNGICNCGASFSELELDCTGAQRQSYAQHMRKNTRWRKIRWVAPILCAALRLGVSRQAIFLQKRRNHPLLFNETSKSLLLSFGTWNFPQWNGTRCEWPLYSFLTFDFLFFQTHFIMSICLS